MEREKEENQKVILDATEKIMVEKRITVLTMENVVQKADLATGTLYLYFNNKESLFAAVNARINKEINQAIKKKMDLFKTGSEKVVTAETATVEFSNLEPEKWKVVSELYRCEFENSQDPSVQEYLPTANEMIRMLADAYQQGIGKGKMHKDLDPISTSIFTDFLVNAFNLTSEKEMLLEPNKINQTLLRRLLASNKYIHPFKTIFKIGVTYA